MCNSAFDRIIPIFFSLELCRFVHDVLHFLIHSLSTYILVTSLFFIFNVELRKIEGENGAETKWIFWPTLLSRQTARQPPTPPKALTAFNGKYVNFLPHSPVTRGWNFLSHPPYHPKTLLPWRVQLQFFFRG